VNVIFNLNIPTYSNISLDIKDNRGMNTFINCKLPTIKADNGTSAVRIVTTNYLMSMKILGCEFGSVIHIDNFPYEALLRYKLNILQDRSKCKVIAYLGNRAAGLTNVPINYNDNGSSYTVVDNQQTTATPIVLQDL
jgi:hypothetical protein